MPASQGAMACVTDFGLALHLAVPVRREDAADGEQQVVALERGPCAGPGVWRARAPPRERSSTLASCEPEPGPERVEERVDTGAAHVGHEQREEPTYGIGWSGSMAR